jgi:hypothetical protein
VRPLLLLSCATGHPYASRLLCTYLSLRSGVFPKGVVPDSYVTQLKHYLNERLDKAGSLDNFRENWSLSLEDMDCLRKVME